MDAHQYYLQMPSGRKLKVVVNDRLSQRDIAWLHAIIAHNDSNLDIAFRWTSEQELKD